MRLDIDGDMKREEYWIDIINLKNGTYTYEFNINNEFFDFFENSLVDRGSLKAVINLEKNERLIRAIFELSGTVELICDRSLKTFNYSLKSKNEHVYKFSGNADDDTEDITHLKSTTEQIDLGHLIYEYISINIPMRKIHPDHIGENENENDFYFKTETKTNQDSKEESIDPRWEALKKLNK